MLLTIHSDNPPQRLIDRAAGILRNGGIIAYPTDTYYGIGCDIMNKHAIELVYQIRQRDKKKPFSFICADLKHISAYAKVSNYAYNTMKRLLPGPYTFVLEGTKLVPKIMLTKRKTAGIRVPNNAICLSLVQALGHPILSASAKAPTGEPFYDPSLLHDHFGGRIDAVIDGGPVPGRPSSVISLIDDVPDVLREGLGDITMFA